MEISSVYTVKVLLVAVVCSAVEPSVLNSLDLDVFDTLLSTITPLG